MAMSGSAGPPKRRIGWTVVIGKQIDDLLTGPIAAREGVGVDEHGVRVRYEIRPPILDRCSRPCRFPRPKPRTRARARPQPHRHVSERTKHDARAARLSALAQVVLLGVAFVGKYAAIGSSTAAGGAVSRASVATSTWRRSAPGLAALQSGLPSALVRIGWAFAMPSARTGSASPSRATIALIASSEPRTWARLMITTGDRVS
jgi:hypothetical protein